MKTITKLILALALVPSISQGIVLALYDFEANPSSSGDSETNSVASDIVRSNTNFAFGTSGGSGLILANNTNISITTSSAPTTAPAPLTPPGNYIEFSLDPNAGQQVTYTNLRGTFRAEAGSDWTGSWDLAASTDGFVLNSTSLGTFSSTQAEGAVILSLPLASLGTLEDTVTFRLIPYDGGETSTGRRLRIFDLELNGTVSPIPEPSVAMIGALGALALLRRRRA